MDLIAWGSSLDFVEALLQLFSHKSKDLPRSGTRQIQGFLELNRSEWSDN
jgi:hypothetical protein